MSIIEIPRVVEHRCDRCGTTNAQQTTGKGSRPPRWVVVKVEQNAADGLADASFERHLCPKCGPHVAAAVAEMA